MEKYEINPFNAVYKKATGEPLKSGHITTIYGNAASGKTTSCLLAAISCAKNSWKTIYIDTEGGFDIDRLKQLYFGDINDILDNMFLIQPKTFSEQYDTITRLNGLCKDEKVRLVVIDTIGSRYRVLLNQDPKKTNQMMLDQLVNLVRIARDMEKVVLMTNQVYANVKEKDEVRMVGGNMVEKMSKIIIELNKKDDMRTARLIKYKYDENKQDHPMLKKDIGFDIKKDGLFLRDNMP